MVCSAAHVHAWHRICMCACAFARVASQHTFMTTNSGFSPPHITFVDANAVLAVLKVSRSRAGHERVCGSRVHGLGRVCVCRSRARVRTEAIETIEGKQDYRGYRDNLVYRGYRDYYRGYRGNRNYRDYRDSRLSRSRSSWWSRHESAQLGSGLKTYDSYQMQNHLCKFCVLRREKVKTRGGGLCFCAATWERRNQPKYKTHPHTPIPPPSGFLKSTFRFQNNAAHSHLKEDWLRMNPQVQSLALKQHNR